MNSASDDAGHDHVRRDLLFGLTAVTGAGTSALVLGQARQAEARAVPVTAGGIDIRALGARVDGLSDDTAALRAAAAARRVIMIEGPVRIDGTVDLPPETTLQGTGVHRARIVLGPRGRLRVSGTSFERRVGGGVIRDLSIAPVDRANTGPALELRHIDHFLIDNVIFYRAAIVMDDHHYVSFRDCQFFGDDDRVSVRSTCASQPSGSVAISENPVFSRCFFSACPVDLEDTVGARLTDCTMFAGPFGVRSRRRLSRGNDREPFFMGPTLSGCVLDSIDGMAVDVEGGGTDCRLSNNFISGGRTRKSPGARFTNSSGVEIIGNRFEWCGSAGLALDACEKIGIVGNSFANIASGPAVLARRSRAVHVVANSFENRSRWGGSGAGGTTLALDCDAACQDWVVTSNPASGLRDARVSTLNAGLVENNPGWPAATERGWPAGPSAARPTGVVDGYRWYDQSLGLWLHWHSGSSRWRDAAGRMV